jgi:hypothetical protein
MEIRPIFSSLLRNKTGALLIAAQVALSLAIVANALYIIQDRIARTARLSGVADESVQIRIAATPIKDPDTAEAKLALAERVSARCARCRAWPRWRKPTSCRCRLPAGTWAWRSRSASRNRPRTRPCTSAPIRW